MPKDTSYYNKEGSVYSKKRYPDTSTDYVHFFFKKRKDILMRMLRDITTTHPQMSSLLEVGCADGVVIRDIKRRFPQFLRLVGIDVAPSMIAEADRRSAEGIRFLVRNAQEAYGAFDVVIEVGVVNLTDMETEFNFAKKHMKPGGYYICSLASKTSSRSRLKIPSTDFSNHLSFEEYERALSTHFFIVDQEAYGLFVPFIWKFPLIGRILQPIAETAGKYWTRLFHEKIYLLQLR